MNLRQAAQQALEALEGLADYRYTDRVKNTMASLRQALAEPEQEPVAWMFQHEETGRTMCVDAQQVEWGFEKGNPRLKKIAPLYTAPTPRRPLPAHEIVQMYDENPRSDAEMIEFARAVERAHGIGGGE